MKRDILIRLWIVIGIVAIVACVIGCRFSILAAEEESESAEKDSSAGLPEQYAKDYLIARSTISPDKKFAVIYPTLEAERTQDYIVTLRPFAVLMSLDTDDPYFEHQSNGGIKAEWSDDSSVAIITLDGKWGPRDVFLVEFHNGKVNRMTNILRKAHDLMLPNYRKSKAAHYKGSFDFILIEDAVFKLDGPHRVVIDADADSDPGYHPDLSDREWRGHIEAVWDIAQAKFTSKKVSGGPPAKED